MSWKSGYIPLILIFCHIVIRKYFWGGFHVIGQHELVHNCEVEGEQNNNNKKCYAVVFSPFESIVLKLLPVLHI